MPLSIAQKTASFTYKHGFAKWAIFLGTFLFCIGVYAQSSKLPGMSEEAQREYDSIYTILPRLKDEKKIIALSRATQLVTFLSTELSLKYLAEAESISNKLNDPYYQGYVLWMWTAYYSNVSNVDATKKEKAMQLADSTLKFYEKNSLDDDVLLGDIYSVYANILYNAGKFSQAINYYFLSMAAHEKIKGMEKTSVEHFKRIGEGFYYLGEYHSALTYYTKALEFAKKSEYQWMVRVLHNDIGLLYGKMELPKEAIMYFKFALEDIKKENSESPVILEGKSVYLSNIGNEYYKLNQIDSALFYFKKGLEIRKGLGYKHLLVRSLTSIGKCHAAGNNPSAAQAQFDAAFALLKEVEDEGAWLYPLHVIGKFYVQIGKADSAIVLLKKGLEIAKKRKERDQEKDFYEALSDAYAQLGLAATALNFYKMYSSLKDTLYDESKQRNLIEINAKYDVDIHRERAEAARLENSLNEERLKRQRWFTVAVAAVLAMTALTAFVLYRARNRQRQINQKLQEQNDEISRQKLQIEVQAVSLKEKSDELQTTLNSLQALNHFKESMIGMAAHDLKNPLNAMLVISEYIDSPQTKKIIQTSSRRMLNLILTMLDVQKHEATGLKIITKDFDITDAIEDAHSQVAYLLETKHISFSVEDSCEFLLHADYELTVRVLVNLLTNAVKYTPVNGNIRIEIQKIEGNMLALSVQDSGEGIPKDKLEHIFELYGQANAKNLGITRSTGMGLYFCKVVAEAHGGKITVESELNVGTKFIFTLPQSLAVKGVNGKYVKPEAILIKLTLEEKETLMPFIDKLKLVQVYEAGKALTILDQVIGFDAWKSLVKDSIFSGNETKFRELIDCIDSE